MPSSSATGGMRRSLAHDLEAIQIRLHMLGIDIAFAVVRTLRVVGEPMSTAAQTRSYELPIGGAWTPATAGGTYDTLNPFTGEPWATVPEGGAEDVDRAVRAAREALRGPWGRMSATERARVLAPHRGRAGAGRRPSSA